MLDISRIGKIKISKILKSLFISFTVLLVLLVSLEMIARHFNLGEGHYSGFVHKNGYYVFKPKQKLKHVNTVINSNGFRGRDFENIKKPGTFRIICMGASSTFGYGNNDDSTYPKLLEKLMNENNDFGNVEVINAGIPYSRTTHLASMFEHELIELDPDLVIIYTGFNDASHANISRSAVGRIYKWLFENSEAAYLPQLFLKKFIIRKKKGVGKKIIGYISNEKIQQAYRKARSEFRKQILKIIDIGRHKDVKIVLVTQQVGTYGYSSVPNEIKAMTYYQKKKTFHELLQTNDKIETLYGVLLVHTKIMEELRMIARQYDIPIVDAIKAIDETKNITKYLVSHVHLSAIGNEIMAKGIYEIIIKEDILTSSR